MTRPFSPRAQAILLMITAMLFFSAMDACAKGLAPRVGSIPAIWVRYTGQCLFVLMLINRNLPAAMRTRHPYLQLLRSIFLLIGTGCFFFGVAHIGLAEATAIMDLNPVLITLGAALFLGESIGPRRIFAIGISLVAALIIIRPGGAVFSPWALLPLVAAFSYSGYNIVTRFVSHNDSNWTSLLYTALFGAVVLTAIVPFHWVRPDGTAILLMLVIAVCGTLSQLCLIRALSLGEAGMLAPFAYSGLIFATVWGAVFFTEWPDFWTSFGAVMIVAAGVYVWYRETFPAKSNT
ncbi:MAG: DMT family transporter [Paracoccaceae bacterium]